MTEYSNQASKFLKKSSIDLAQRIKARVERLEQEPFPQDVERIQGEANKFRVRVGDYRIIYQPGDPLFIVRIDKRETVY
jgi:mRNA-degrading endonuclease RelE of RelBE toxin-antitoxin system